MLPASRSGEHHRRRRRRRCCCVPDLPCPPLIPIPLVQALFADPEQQGVRLRVTATKATGADQEQGGPLLHEEVLDRAAFQARAGGAAVAAPPPPAKQSSRARAAAAYSALKPFVIISLSCEATQRNWGHLLAGVVAAPCGSTSLIIVPLAPHADLLFTITDGAVRMVRGPALAGRLAAQHAWHACMHARCRLACLRAPVPSCPITHRQPRGTYSGTLPMPRLPACCRLCCCTRIRKVLVRWRWPPCFRSTRCGVPFCRLGVPCIACLLHSPCTAPRLAALLHTLEQPSELLGAGKLLARATPPDLCLHPFLAQLAGVVTNLAAGLMGAKWGIRYTLLTGLCLQLVGIGMLFGWQVGAGGCGPHGSGRRSGRDRGRRCVALASGGSVTHPWPANPCWTNAQLVGQSHSQSYYSLWQCEYHRLTDQPSAVVPCRTAGARRRLSCM